MHYYPFGNIVWFWFSFILENRENEWEDDERRDEKFEEIYLVLATLSENFPSYYKLSRKNI